MFHGWNGTDEVAVLACLHPLATLGHGVRANLPSNLQRGRNRGSGRRRRAYGFYFREGS